MKSFKLLLLLTFGVFPSLLLAQDPGLEGASIFQVAPLHAGSYAKERPIFQLEQRVLYRFNARYSAGAGTGLGIFPGALGLPLYAQGNVHFAQGKGRVGQSYGFYLKLSDVFFAAHRYAGELGWGWSLTESIVLEAQGGYLFWWDRFGGRALSGQLGVGLRYGLGKGK